MKHMPLLSLLALMVVTGCNKHSADNPPAGNSAPAASEPSPAPAPSMPSTNAAATPPSAPGAVTPPMGGGTNNAATTNQ